MILRFHELPGQCLYASYSIASADRPEQTAEVLQLCGSCTRTDVALHNVVVRSRTPARLGVGLVRRNVKGSSRRSEGSKPKEPKPAGAKAKAKAKASRKRPRTSDA